MTIVVRSVKTLRGEEHGSSKTRLYQIWRDMKKRCNNPKRRDYPRYGGRGIRVCRQWLDSFAAFQSWSLGNGYEDTLRIDRIDNDGDYEPRNCRWTTSLQQSRNRSDNVMVEIDGQTMCIVDWAIESGIQWRTLYSRHARGMSWIEAITTPLANAKQRA